MNPYKTVTQLMFAWAFCVTLSAQAQQPAIRSGIKNIVFKLNKEATLHLGAPVGFAGIPETKNKYYKLFQKLSSKATDKELLLLTNDASKTIVLYSYLILYSRNYSELKDIFLKNINDTTEVWIAGGCTGVVDKVNSFMLRQLNPAYMDSRQPYLTQEEYDNYTRQLVK